MPAPQKGEMVLYDFARPPLLGGQYRLELRTDVRLNGAAVPLEARDSFFDVVGPRFALSPSEVSGVFPPRNGHGAFHGALPHVALGRRTLPWERPLGDAFTAAPDQTPFPWLALVLFQEGEYTLLRNTPLEQVVPTDVFNRMGRPQGIFCDAVEASTGLLRSILPMPEELQLLTHVRQVNVDDRELSAGDSDGFFAVVMSNRVPEPGTKHRACLVSVEERTDLLPTADSPQGGFGGHLADVVVGFGDGLVRASAADASFGGTPSFLGGLRDVRANLGSFVLDGSGGSGGTPPVSSRLVLLHSWTFECVGDGTFRELLQHLDVGMIGDVAAASRLEVTDTGHIRIDVTDRDGAPETSWYRGPLAAAPMSRDPNGPYHAADQARRVAADTGAEDISYAAAFEVGRLLAAADARLAQELMRWRRGAYRQSARGDSVNRVATEMTLLQAIDLQLPLAPLIAASAVARLANGARRLADPYRLTAIERSPLLHADAIRETFKLESTEQANALLGRRVAVLDTPVTVPTTGGKPLETLEAVLRDNTGMRRLIASRARTLDNVKLMDPTPGRTP